MGLQKVEPTALVFRLARGETLVYGRCRALSTLFVETDRFLGTDLLLGDSVARAFMRQAGRDCQWPMIAPAAFTTIEGSR